MNAEVLGTKRFTFADDDPESNPTLSLGLVLRDKK